MLFLGRLVDGASGASVSVAQAAVADVAEPADRPALLGLLGAAFGVGFVAGPALGALAALGGPHVPFYVAGAIALVNGLVAIRRLPETAPARRRVDVGSPPSRLEKLAPRCAEPTCGDSRLPRSRRRRRSPASRRRSPCSADRFDLTLSSTGAVFAGIGLFLVLVQATLVQPVVQRLGPTGTLRPGSASTSSGCCCWRSPSTGSCSSPRSPLVVGQGLTTPTLASLVAGRSPIERRGHGLGLQQMSSGLGRVVGPIVAGALFQHVGVGAPYVLGAGITAGALALVLTLHEQRSPSAPTRVLPASGVG